MVDLRTTPGAATVRRLDLAFSRLAERIAPPHGSSHTVQLCENDAEYARTVARFFAAGLAAGHAALGVTTASHRDDILAALASLGCQPARAQRDGRLVFLDAGDTLAAICADGTLDRERFERVVSAGLRDVSSSGTHAVPFVHGEMVNVLCDNGDIEAALQLEALWNELGETRRFHLLCTYTASTFAAVDRSSAYDRARDSAFHE